MTVWIGGCAIYQRPNKRWKKNIAQNWHCGMSRLLAPANLEQVSFNTSSRLRRLDSYASIPNRNPSYLWPKSEINKWKRYEKSPDRVVHVYLTGKSTLGFQPSLVRALVESPKRSSWKDHKNANYTQYSFNISIANINNSKINFNFVKLLFCDVKAKASRSSAPYTRGHPAVKPAAVEIGNAIYFHVLFK